MPHSLVSASVAEEFPEAVARKQIVTSPQTTGPSGGALSWGLNRIDQRTPALSSAASYDFSEDGGGVTAYILDSGVNASHPEFGSRVKEGWSYRSSSSALTSYRNSLADYVANPNNGIEACTQDGSHAVDPATFDNPTNVDGSDKGQTDNDGHGTHVAGIIGGDTTGVAKNVSIVPVRSLDSCGNGTTTMILEGLDWILNHHNIGERAILNLSVGFASQVSSVDNRITSLMNEGVVVIAAAGNDASSACGTTPAATLGTISVTSMTDLDGESSFSNYGLCVDIFSPGSAIKSAFPYLSGTVNTYATQSGTSMAAPFISGAVTRFLQLLETGPTNFATGPTAAWTWLRDNSTTNAITYFNSGRNPQTNNRLLYVPASSVRIQQLTATPTNGGAIVSWQNAEAATTYVARAFPGNASCTVIASSSCTITGLTSGVSYVISTVASNASGKGASSTFVTPQGPPVSPTALTASVASKAVTLNWAAVSNTTPLTYVVTTSNGATVCTTSATTCTVTGLTNGIDYSFTVASQAQGLMSTASSQPIVVRPGFTVRKTVVAKKSKTPLTWFVKSISTGKKTWSESGSCSIVSSRLVAPSRATKCVVTLKVAKTSKYPAMSTKVTITVK
jgi:subtilisin family serine protease